MIVLTPTRAPNQQYPCSSNSLQKGKSITSGNNCTKKTHNNNQINPLLDPKSNLSFYNLPKKLVAMTKLKNSLKRQMKSTNTTIKSYNNKDHLFLTMATVPVTSTRVQRTFYKNSTEKEISKSSKPI